MRFWIVLGSLVVLVIGGLFFRQASLDDRIDRLWVAIDGDAGREGSSILGRGGSSLTQTNAEHETRLEKLERRIESLERRVASLQAEPEPAAQASAQKKAAPEPAPRKSTSPDLATLTSKEAEERILSVVAEEAKRIHGKQLEWHRDKVVQDRLEGLQQFAQEQSLSEHQREELEELLVQEVDEMVQILRNPQGAHPETLISRFANLRGSTNEESRMLLDEQQFQAFMKARKLERDRWLPWLPQEKQGD